MPSVLRVFPFFFTGICTLLFHAATAQTNLIQQEALLLQKSIEANHFQPRATDDAFSKELLQSYLKALDPYHLYFTAADYKNFSAYDLTLDDELKGNGWKFFPQVATVYKERLQAASKILETFASKPFDYSIPEKLELEAAKTSYATDPKALAQQWAKWIKFQTLRQLVNAFDGQAKTETSDKELLAKEPEIRKKVLKVEQRRIRKILEHPQGYEQFLKNQYFNAITESFDPHTAYFSKTDLQNFQNHVSAEGLSFGMDLAENEFGDVEVARLVPGGPAWKSNELYEGDVLLNIKWANNKGFDLTGADQDEVESMLEASNSALLELTVRSTEGATKTVKLKKEKIKAEENIVRSFIMKGEKSVGYISLPSFYTEWEDRNGLGCANDVAKEIVKLQKEKIDGLILDLRYNGGGALGEGLNLAGLFIDEGPLLVIQGKDGKANTIKDFNRGTVYDGPLLVMVNGQSASASELLAATLQDYNRAIIAGSATFGKSTGQGIIPLDPNQVQVKNNKSPYGFVKITQDKIYRVTGKTAQLQGLKPDVELPDVFEAFDYKESIYPNALKNDSIFKKVYYTRLPAIPAIGLQEKSNIRLLKHEGFKKIEELRKSPSFKSVTDLQEVTLTLGFFRKLNKDNVLWHNLLAYAEEATVHAFKAENPTFNQALIEADPYDKEINESVISNLEKDIYIEECFLILNDFINQKTR